MYGTHNIGKTVLMITITYMFFYLLINKKRRLFSNSFVYRYIVMGGILVMCYFLAFTTLFYHVGTFKCGAKMEVDGAGIEGKNGYKIHSVDDYYAYMKAEILPAGTKLDPQTGDVSGNDESDDE